jgi:hypothetical protein
VKQSLWWSETYAITASRVVFLSMAALGEATPPIDERCVAHMQVSRGLLLDMDSDRYRGLFGGEQKTVKVGVLECPRRYSRCGAAMRR